MGFGLLILQNDNTIVASVLLSLNMLQELFENTVHELRGALTRRNHPFKYTTLSTVSSLNKPKSRTVVVREVSTDLKITIFTDERSGKIEEVLQNNETCMLFYHPKKLLQVTIYGQMQRCLEENALKNYFHRVTEKSIKDYTTINAPGTIIKNPDHVEYLENQNYFAVLQLMPNRVEILQLKRPNHLRAVFERVENEWHGSWITP